MRCEFAITKGEFLPGPEHTSLIESTSWQLFGLPSSGSPLDAHSASNYLIREWLGTDAILVVLGSVLSSIALCFMKLRPVAVAVLIQLAMLARGGYLLRGGRTYRPRAWRSRRRAPGSARLRSGGPRPGQPVRGT